MRTIVWAVAVAEAAVGLRVVQTAGRDGASRPSSPTIKNSWYLLTIYVYYYKWWIYGWKRGI